MHFALDNQTPLPASASSHPDADGRPAVLVIAKACWRLDTGRLAAAEQQAPLRAAPLQMRLGQLELEPCQKQAVATRMEEAFVWLDHEMGPPKGRFDVLVAGHVHAPGQEHAVQIDARLQVAGHAMSVRAFAPRRWRLRALTGYGIVSAEPGVRRVPLSYAFAAWDQGLGQPPEGDAIQWLPWLEDPARPARQPDQKPAPWSFSFWPESAAHRTMHAGTYDERWQRERSPSLPEDFDGRFYNTAHPQMQLPEAPLPGSEIRLFNLSTAPVLSSRYPNLSLSADVFDAEGVCVSSALRADTLLIEPDENRFSVVWRALVPAKQVAGRAGRVRLYRAAPVGGAAQSASARGVLA